MCRINLAVVGQKHLQLSSYSFPQLQCTLIYGIVEIQFAITDRHKSTIPFQAILIHYYYSNHILIKDFIGNEYHEYVVNFEYISICEDDIIAPIHNSIMQNLPTIARSPY